MSNSTSRREFLGAVVSTFLLQGCGAGSSGAADGTSNSPTPEGEVSVSVPPLKIAVGQPIYIAHRGSAALYPEETYAAYDGSLLHGQALLECDVQSLKDATLVLMHDATVDRTTNGTGSLTNLTLDQLKAMSVDGDAWHGSNFGNQTVPLFGDWVDRYKTKAILVPEAKDLVSMSPMLRILDQARASKQHVLIQCFNLDALKLAVASGYQGCLLDSGISNPSSIKGTGVAWVGIASTATDAQMSAWVAGGASVLVWTVNRRFERDAKLALGVQGFFSDDPAYLSAEQPLATEDKFGTGTWMPGMLGAGADLDLTSRGKFFPDGYWGYDSTAINYVGCLHGYLCPIKGKTDTRSFQLNLNIKFDSALNNDATRWASVFISNEDRQFYDSNEGAVGFHLLFRKNGSIEVYKKVAGRYGALLKVASGAKIADGEEVSFRVTMSETTVAIARLSATGEGIASVSVDDSTQKGGYVQLGRNGLACKFRKVSVV